MTDPGTVLKDKLADLRRWERRKRRERLLLESLCYTALAAAALVLARALAPVDARLLWFAPAVFAAAAAGVFLFRPWREQAFVRSLKQVDDGLTLGERVLTAWEILFRPREAPEEPVPPEEALVVEEAAEKVGAVRLRALCRRRFTWHAAAAPVLALLAVAGLWLPPGGAPEAASATSRLAEAIREHARELEQRAREQDLAESRRMAEALRELAERQLGETGADKARLEASVGALVDVLEEMSRSWPAGAGLDWPALSDKALERLREHLRRSGAGDMAGSGGKSRADLLESLGLSSLDRRPGRSQDMSEQEVQQFLERLEREAGQEQDRRSLEATQQLLTELLLGDAPDESVAESAPGRRPGGARGRGAAGAAARQRARKGRAGAFRPGLPGAGAHASARAPGPRPEPGLRLPGRGPSRRRHRAGRAGGGPVPAAGGSRSVVGGDPRGVQGNHQELFPVPGSDPAKTIGEAEWKRHRKDRSRRCATAWPARNARSRKSGARCARRWWATRS